MRVSRSLSIQLEQLQMQLTNNGTIVVTSGENASGSFIAKAATGVTNLTYNLYIPASEWKRQLEYQEFLL